MQARRLTPTAVCVLAAFIPLLAACAGHTAPPARSGDVPKSSAATATAAIQSGVIPTNARLLPNGLLIGTKLDQTITAATPVGFAFSTKVTNPIAAKDGAIAIPIGTVMRGVVMGVRPGSGANPAIVCLNLDFLELNGRSYGIRSSVKSVLVDDKPATILARDSIAKLFPNEPDVALRGTIVALTPSSTAAAAQAAELPVGTTFVVELDSVIAVQR
jgi:hypothetical protein